MHVGVGLLDLVEQHDAVGAAPHRLGQHAALAVADVAGRRALERRDGVRLLELAHVDGDEVLLAAVERLGERERGLGLADAGGAGQHEDADRLARVVEAGARGLDALGDHLERVILADDALAERVGQLQHRLDLVLDHAADRNAGPVARRRWRPPARRRVGRISGRVALQLGELVLQLARARRAASARSLGSAAPAARRRRLGCVGAVARQRAAGACRPAAPAPRRASRAQLAQPDAVDQRLLRRSSASRARRGASSSARAARRRSLSRSAVVDADRRLAADDLELGLERLDAAPAVLDLGRHGVLADGDARAGGVEQAHRLVGQLARRDVAVRELAPPPRSPRRASARGGASPASTATPRIIRMAFSSLGSSTCTTWKRRVSAGSFSMYFLYSAQVVARDGAQLAARQRRLEQVGRVAGAGRAAGADQRVRLVDEQDDRLGRRLHLVDHLAQPLLELALHAGAGLQQADVERAAARRPSAAAARRRARCAARSPRRPRSCRRRPRR